MSPREVWDQSIRFPALSDTFMIYPGVCYRQLLKMCNWRVQIPRYPRTRPCQLKVPVTQNCYYHTWKHGGDLSTANTEGGLHPYSRKAARTQVMRHMWILFQGGQTQNHKDRCQTPKVASCHHLVGPQLTPVTHVDPTLGWQGLFFHLVQSVVD